MDAVVDLSYTIARVVQVGFNIYTQFCLANFPHSYEFALVCYLISSTTGTYDYGKGKPKEYWLHSFLMTVFASFGGGMIAPMLLGKPPSIMTNDTAIPICMILWYLVNYVVEAYDIFMWTPFKVVWNIFGVSSYRTQGAVKMVKLATSVLKPGPFYPSPVIGTLIAATVVSCGGKFMPPSKGLYAVAKDTNWAIQAAFLNGAFFFFMVKDKGFIGQGFRSVLGNMSSDTVTIIICTANLIMCALQQFFDPSANLFTPFHKLGYLVFQVQGPLTKANADPKKESVGWPFKTRIKFEAFMDNLRLAIVGVFLVWVLGSRVPAVTLPAVPLADVSVTDGVSYATLSTVTLAGLPVGGAIGNSQWTGLLPAGMGSAAADALTSAMMLEEIKLCKGAECSADVASDAVTALQSDEVEKVAYKLSVHNAAALMQSDLSGKYAMSTKALDASNANLLWSSVLPAEPKTLEASYTSGSTYLFLTESADLYLLSSVAFSGTLVNPGQLTGRVLWTGKAASCPAEVAATGLFLEKSTGVPTVSCADGSTAAVSAGKVFVNKNLPRPTPAAGSTKSEL